MEPSMDLETKLEKYQIKMRFKKNLAPIDQEVQELTKSNSKQNKAFYPDKKNFLVNYFQNIQVQNLLQLVGDQGRYQKILMIILCAYNFFYAFVGFQLGYIFYEPDFYCYDANYQATKCTQKHACQNPYGFYTESQIHSIVTKFNLYCKNSKEVFISQGVFIILGGIIAFVFGVLSDIIGRQKVFVFAWIFSTFGISLALFSDTLTLTTVGMVFAWAGMDMFFSMVFIYVNEILGGSLREKSNAILFLFWALGEIIINIINIGIKEYKINFMVQLIPLLALAPFFYFIKESPYVLYKIKNIKRLFNVLYFIGKENKQSKEQIFDELNQQLKIEELDVSGIDVLKTLKIQKKKGGKIKKKDVFKQFIQSYVKLFSDKKRTLKLIGVCLLAAHMYIGYALSVLIPQRLGLSNIYINGVLLGVSELIGNFIIIPIGDKVKRRYLNFFCSLTITILCSLLFILGLFKNKINENLLQWLETLLGSAIKMVICMSFAMIFTYIAELFPTRIRGLALGFCVLAGRLSTIFTLTLENFTNHFNLNPMIGVIFGAIVTMPISLLLPETFGKGIDN